MPLPISKNQLDRLGQRLATTDPITDADHEMLQEVLTIYGRALTGVRLTLEDLGFTVTVRLKTIRTLIDKLRREQGMRLSRVQDLAGARFVVPGTRHDQDAAVGRIVRQFKDDPRQPLVRDRRRQPSSGYRAVHVIVFVAGVPVEVQVRTALQDRWAQVYERLADHWGRAMRYGGEPDEPDVAAAPGHPALTRRGVVGLMQAASEVYAVFEMTQSPLDVPESPALEEQQRSLRARLVAAKKELEAILDMFAQMVG